MRLNLLAITGFLFLLSCSGVEEQDNTQEEQNLEESSPYGPYSIFWQYEDEFSENEKQKLKQWIEEVCTATTKSIGQYPFDLWVTFHYSEKGNPVSFGHTKRKKGHEAIHFYVNPEATLEELLADWTAPHEIAHLSLPFSGRRNRWFSEGYATYMSRQIMIEMGQYTDASFDSIYYNRIGETLYAYGSSTKTHLKVSDSLLDHYIYGDMYWGSSSFFYTIDQQMKEQHNTRFRDVVKTYQENGRMEDDALIEVIASYDRILNDSICKQLMWTYRNEPSKQAMKGFKKSLP